MPFKDILLARSGARHRLGAVKKALFYISLPSHDVVLSNFKDSILSPYYPILRVCVDIEAIGRTATIILLATYHLSTTTLVQRTHGYGCLVIHV